MVARKSALKAFLLSLTAVLLLEACTVDLMGFFASDDMDSRFFERNTFRFLTEADRSLALPEEYAFLVFSDTHIEGRDAFGFENLASVIDPDVKFVVITGDVTQSGLREEVARFIEITQTVGVPCYPMLGNHDVYFGNWSVWKELIGSSCYRIDTPESSTTLFILDSANASFGNTQLEWLEKELKTANSHVFVFTHTNLFVEGMGDLQQLTDVRERARIMSLLEGHCDALFTGHVHKRIIKNFGGVEYITIEDHRSKKTYAKVRVNKAGFQYEFKEL
ncbi:MAG: metallophosphoesterase [Treponema sp.]|jgi:3',5'-cyclic AMP phosphodiesterase CpdA|nr:metallophosphoesterase [Treponema sp.]